MNRTSLVRSLIITIILSFAFASSEAQSFKRPSAPKQNKSLFRKSPAKKKAVKLREPRPVERAKREQEANDKKLKRESADFVKASQKRSIEIQTPAVQERMKQNIKDADARYKVKKKNHSIRNRKTAKKYR